LAEDAGMTLTRARLRYLSAIGAALPSLMLVSCKDPAQPAGGSDASATTSTSSPATASGAPLGTTSASGVATTPPPPADDDSAPTTDGAPRVRPRGPSCPSGDFCVAEGAKSSSPEKAPAPYGKCATSVDHPDDATDSGYHPRRSVRFSAENTAAARAKTANACCYTWVIPCPGGRAFRDATGTASVARTIERNDWTLAIGALALADLAPDARVALAAHWTREAAFEHASIASFAQLTLDLLSVGAPPDLLEAAQRAMLDEIEHARITFALATAYGGAPVGPAALSALPGASRTLAAIARSTFIDACVGESVASATLADASGRASDPVLRDLLARMADDEERHAELAWRIVAWTLRSADPEVARTLADAQDEVTAELVSLSEGVAADGLRANVLREVVLPCTVALLGSTAASMAGRQRLAAGCSPRLQ
jgi:hypothetical protein